MNMDMETKMREILVRYGSEYMLRQLAEECAELTHAALKLIRARRHETPVSEAEARACMIEELADTAIMLDGVFYAMLTRSERNRCGEIREVKELRMVDRLLEGGAGSESPGDVHMGN